MTTNRSLDQMTERFASLPIDFQRAIKDFDYEHRMIALQKKFKLHIDQSYSLEQIVADIIFGDLKTNDFLDKATKNLSIDKDTASEIAFEINKEILEPLRDKIRGIQEAE